VVRIAVATVSPLVAVSQFLHRIAMLGSPAEEGPEEGSQTETIEALMEAGEQEGLLEKEDRRLIQSVVEFGDKTVGEVMTPRQAIVAVRLEATLSELKQTVASKRYTRVPVYEHDLDHIVGFVHAADLFAIEDEDAERRRVSELVRPIPFVPETKPISELLQELQQQAQIAIVVDEYGSVAGLATVEDMVEEIVGEIRDEHEVQDVMPQGDGRYSIPGDMDLDRLQELLKVQLDDSGDARTVSGLVTNALGRVPATGETMERDGVVFQVTDSNGRRVVRLLVSVPQQEAGAEQPQPASNPTLKLFDE
jgi:CBS domain containing-hemolysin-like protein